MYAEVLYLPTKDLEYIISNEVMFKIEELTSVEVLRVAQKVERN